MDKKNILKGRTSGWILKLDINRIVKFIVKLDSKIIFLEVGVGQLVIFYCIYWKILSKQILSFDE